MPRLSSRQARTRDVLKTFIEHHRERVKRLLRRKYKTQHALAQAGLTLDKENSEQFMDPPVDTSPVTMASISTGSSLSLLDSSSSLTSETTSDNCSSDNTPDSGDDADDEDDQNMDVSETDFARVCPNYPLNWVWHNLDKMYDQRYEQPRTTFPRGPAFLRHVLGTMKDTCPDLFRQELRVSPRTFDWLVAKLSEDPIFANNSNNAQMPVEDPLAIALSVSGTLECCRSPKDRKLGRCGKGDNHFGDAARHDSSSASHLHVRVCPHANGYGEGESEGLGRGPLMQSMKKWLVHGRWYTGGFIQLTILVW
ncbi:hypothetical protein MSAN_02305300 [Mycena sanguinolenta]|uniref:Uncharacterized protein n=1 Tax=Mycena sanguinolenta TaxID=230812 RepID=A0A8H7CHH1_9AGAR|nr:hypothetical protein MSAN_02305300 [Mycena sanguinolenta]